MNGLRGQHRQFGSDWTPHSFLGDQVMVQIVGNKKGKGAKVSPIDAASERDPTPEQIAIRSAAIRAGWSDRQRQSRRVTRNTFVLPPLVRIADWMANVASDQRN